MSTNKEAVISSRSLHIFNGSSDFSKEIFFGLNNTVAGSSRSSNSKVHLNDDINAEDANEIKRNTINISFSRNSSSILSKIYGLFKANTLTDVTIKCKGDRLTGHRILLSAMSPLLESAFSPTLQGSVNKEIDLSYFDIKILRMFLEDFCYGKALTINFSNLEKIIEAAIFFETNDVVEKCIEFMHRNRTDENIFQLFLLARSYEQHTSCKRFLEQIKSTYNEQAKVQQQENKSRIENELELLDCEIKQLKLHLQPIQKANISKACLKIFYWINENREIRLEYLENTNYLSTFLPCENIALLKKAFKMKDLELKKITLKEYRFYYKYRIDWNEELPYAIVQGRKVEYMEDHTDKFTCYTVCCSSGELYAIDPHKGIFLHYSLLDEKKMEWKNISISPKQYQYPAVTSVDGNVLLCGGSCQSSCDSYKKMIQKDVYLYHLKTNRWINLASMPSPREKGSAITLGNNLFVIGGIEEAQVHEHDNSLPILIYNIQENKWNIGPILKNSTTFPALAVYKDMIYIFGGEFNGKCSDETIRFNPFTKKLNSCSKMKYRLTMGGTANLGNAIYLVGGFCNNKFVEIIQRYDTMLNEWKIFDKTKALQDEIDLFIW